MACLHVPEGVRNCCLGTQAGLGKCKMAGNVRLRAAFDGGGTHALCRRMHWRHGVHFVEARTAETRRYVRYTCMQTAHKVTARAYRSLQISIRTASCSQTEGTLESKVQ